ncbi:MAG: hypothetical protein JRM80_07260 [Nitrososphaerota archaeon]|nr:hypothetical protein [Nitrososphaerota archaeon]
MPKKDERSLSGACFVKLDSLTELGRLSCFQERAPFPLFAITRGGSHWIAAQADLFMGVPIFYYAETKENGEFLAYRKDQEGEEVRLVEGANNASFLYAPVIKTAKMPGRLDPKDDFPDRFMAMEVKDLQSLAKVATYKMFFEEPALPLFAFKDGGSWIIGTFARIDDYEEASIFFYWRSSQQPVSGFIRYASDKIGDTGFVGKTEEHGYQFVKVIKLAEKHPLVAL